MKRTGILAGLIAVVMLSVAYTALAQNSVLRRSSPEDKAVLDKAPEQVTLFLKQKVDPATTTVKVFDSNNKRVDDGKTLTSENSQNVAVRLKALNPGVYTVRWEAVEATGKNSKQKKANGSFSFQVR